MMEFIVFLVVLVIIFGYFQDKNNSKENTIHKNYTQNNTYIQKNYGHKPEAHTVKVWKRLGYAVKYGESYAYKYYANEIYTEEQVKRISSSYGGCLSSKQKKVKSLGIALVRKSGSKQKAKNILVNHYGFDEDTARYGAGFCGYNNW